MYVHFCKAGPDFELVQYLSKTSEFTSPCFLRGVLVRQYWKNGKGKLEAIYGKIPNEGKCTNCMSYRSMFKASTKQLVIIPCSRNSEIFFPLGLISCLFPLHRFHLFKLHVRARGRYREGHGDALPPLSHRERIQLQVKCLSISCKYLEDTSFSGIDAEDLNQFE